MNNKDKTTKGIKIDKDSLKIKGTLDDVLRASVPKKKTKDNKEAAKTDKDS